MLITRRLRLLSTLLAAKRRSASDGKKARRVFVHVDPPEGADTALTYVATQLPRWEWAFLEARDALDLAEVATSTIIPAHFFSTKKTSTYVRDYRIGRTKQQEPFESVPSGQVFMLQFTLSQHIPPNTDGDGRFTRAPTEAEFDAMLSHIGEHLGMSEWGHARLFGRFKISNYIPDAANKKSEDSSGSGSSPSP